MVGFIVGLARIPRPLGWLSCSKPYYWPWRTHQREEDEIQIRIRVAEWTDHGTYWSCFLPQGTAKIFVCAFFHCTCSYISIRLFFSQLLYRVGKLLFQVLKCTFWQPFPAPLSMFPDGHVAKSVGMHWKRENCSSLEFFLVCIFIFFFNIFFILNPDERGVRESEDHWG